VNFLQCSICQSLGVIIYALCFRRLLLTNISAVFSFNSARLRSLRYLGGELTDHLGYKPHGEPAYHQTNRRSGATRNVLKQLLNRLCQEVLSLRKFQCFRSVPEIHRRSYSQNAWFRSFQQGKEVGSGAERATYLQ
jgi:hypothetical protein